MGGGALPENPNIVGGGVDPDIPVSGVPGGLSANLLRLLSAGPENGDPPGVTVISQVPIPGTDLILTTLSDGTTRVDRASSGTQAAGPSGPTAAELALDARRLDIQEQANQITIRGQDIQERLDEIELERRQLQLEIDQATGAAELALQERNIARLELLDQENVRLADERIALDAVQLEINQQLADIQQQAQDLSAARLQLEELGLNLDAALGVGGALGNIGAQLGTIEQQRAETLANLIANPRDAVQTNIALGGEGGDILSRLLRGEQIGPQSTRLINGPVLGENFQAVLDQLLARPDLDIINQAVERLTEVPQFGNITLPGQTSVTPPGLPAPPPVLGPGPPSTAADFSATPPDFPDTPQQLSDAFNQGGLPAFLGRLGAAGQQVPTAADNAVTFAQGGSLVTNEPIVGVGTQSGKPRFIAGEGGRPELINVVPFQEGGDILTGTSGGVRDILGGLRAGTLTQAAAQSAGEVLVNQPAPAPPAVGGVRDILEGLLEGTTTPAQAQSAGEVLVNQPPDQVVGQPVSTEPGPPLGGFPNIGAAVRALMNFTPRQFFSLLPSQKAIWQSAVSALGLDPADVEQSILRGFPQGANPNTVSFGNFAAGGQILAGGDMVRNPNGDVLNGSFVKKLALQVA